MTLVEILMWFRDHKYYVVTRASRERVALPQIKQEKFVRITETPFDTYEEAWDWIAEYNTHGGKYSTLREALLDTSDILVLREDNV